VRERRVAGYSTDSTFFIVVRAARGGDDLCSGAGAAASRGDSSTVPAVPAVRVGADWVRAAHRAVLQLTGAGLSLVCSNHIEVLPILKSNQKTAARNHRRTAFLAAVSRSNSN